MPDFTNIVTVDLTEATGYNVEAHRAVHQWDSGVILQLTGATFPQGTTCQFDTKTTTFNQELTDGACEIPNALLGYDMIGDIKAHVKIDDDNYGIVVYDIHIPVIRRPKPDSYIYTDNSSSSNGWVKSKYGYRVNEDQTILGRTELSINDNQTILDGTSLSLNNQQTVLDGTHLSLASGLFYADATHLQLNSGRITIGPTTILVDDRVYGTTNRIDQSKFEIGTFGVDGVISANNRRIRSALTKVNPSTTYTLHINSSSTAKIFVINWYNAWGQVINTQTVLDPIVDTYTFTTDSQCEYMRIIFRKSDNEIVSLTDVVNAKLEKGASALAFDPHALDVVELTNRRFLQDWESKNLAPMSVLQQGGLNSDASASPFPSNIRCRTDYIQVKPSTTYTVSTNSIATPTAVRFFRVRGIHTSSYNNPDSHTSVMTFTTPDDCNYIRIVFVNATSASSDISVMSISQFQLEIGIKATPYQPYALNSSENCYINDLKSKNIYDSTKAYLGAASSTTNDDIDKNLGGNNYISTGAIAVKPNCVYTFSSKQQGLASGVNLSVRSVREASSNRAITGYQNFNNNPMPCTFVTGESTYWINIVIGTGGTTALTLSNITEMQLEEGPVATTYKPYVTPINTTPSLTISSPATTLLQLISRCLSERRGLNGIATFSSDHIHNATLTIPAGPYFYDWIPSTSSGTYNEAWLRLYPRSTSLNVKYELQILANGNDYSIRSVLPEVAIGSPMWYLGGAMSNNAETVTFTNIALSATHGVLILIGDGNGTPLFSIYDVHNNTLFGTGTGGAGLVATFNSSAATLVVTCPKWSSIQMYSTCFRCKYY